MISTPPGTSAQESLKDAFEPVLLANTESVNPNHLSDHLISLAQCEKIADPFKKLKSRLNEIESAMSKAGSAIRFDTRNLQTLVQKYHQNQLKLVRRLKSLGAGELKKIIKINFGPNVSAEYPLEQILVTDFDQAIDKAKELMRLFPKEQKKYEGQIAGYTTAKEIKATELKAHPQLENFMPEYLKVLKEENYSNEVAHEIALEEREIYDQIYSAESKLQELKPNTPSPCKDFKL
jgi:hypothetical protein